MFAVVAAVLGYFIASRGNQPEVGPVSLAMLPPEGRLFTQRASLAVSPDGKHVVFRADSGEHRELWLRDLASAEARPLAGADGAVQPFWSPDSRSLGFIQGSQLKRIEISGGPPTAICDGLAATLRGASWSGAKANVILFALDGVGIFQVPATGGSAKLIMQPNKGAGEESLDWPWFLPDDHRFLFVLRGRSDVIYAADLESGKRTRIAESPNGAQFASGQLLFVQGAGTFGGGTMMAQPFDAASLRTTGNAVPVAEKVGGNNITGQVGFSVSRNRVLVWSTAAAFRSVQLAWFDRSGKQLGTLGPYSSIDEWAVISPDGATVATAMRGGAASDIWLYNLARGTASRFTFGPRDNFYPIWSPDGKRLAFASTNDGLQHESVKPMDGGKQEALAPAAGDPPRRTLVEDWSPDGRFLVERAVAGPTGDDIWVQPLFGDRKPFAYLQTAFVERNARISPDGKWLAYTSNETGRYEIYVQSFPMPGAKLQITSAGGDRPVWSRDGRELFFISPDDKMMAVPVRSGATFEAGQPKALFQTNIGTSFNNHFDVSKDGRFLIPVRAGQEGASTNVLLNWPAALKR